MSSFFQWRVKKKSIFDKPLTQGKYFSIESQKEVKKKSIFDKPLTQGSCFSIESQKEVYF